MEGDLTEEIKVALSEEERLARAVTKSSRRGIMVDSVDMSYMLLL